MTAPKTDKILDICPKISAHLLALKDLTAELEKAANLPDILTHYKAIYEIVDALDGVKKQAGKMKDDMSKRIIPEVMSAEDVKTITMDGLGRRFTISHRYFCSMPDKPAGFKYLRSNGAGDIIQETVNASTLAAWAKNRLVEEGLDLPEDIFNVNIIPSVSMTKAK